MVNSWEKSFTLWKQIREDNKSNLWWLCFKDFLQSSLFSLYYLKIFSVKKKISYILHKFLLIQVDIIINNKNFIPRNFQI